MAKKSASSSTSTLERPTELKPNRANGSRRQRGGGNAEPTKPAKAAKPAPGPIADIPPADIPPADPAPVAPPAPPAEPGLPVVPGSPETTSGFLKPPSKEKMSRPESASNAAKARWAGEEKEEAAILQQFDKLSVQDGLEVLARMRHNTEVAARIINDKIAKEGKSTRCCMCKGAQLPGRQWTMVKPVRNPATQGYSNLYFCRPECVARYNHQQQGVHAVPR